MQFTGGEGGIGSVNCVLMTQYWWQIQKRNFSSWHLSLGVCERKLRININEGKVIRFSYVKRR